MRDRLLPIVRLADVLGLKRTFRDLETKEELIDQRQQLFNPMRLSETKVIVEESENELEYKREYKLTNSIRILVIKIGARRLGIAVDTIHGSEEILVKNAVFIHEIHRAGHHNKERICSNRSLRHE